MRFPILFSPSKIERKHGKGEGSVESSPHTSGLQAEVFYSQNHQSKDRKTSPESLRAWVVVL